MLTAGFEPATDYTLNAALAVINWKFQSAPFASFVLPSM
jgi:hypothetical protein